MTFRPIVVALAVMFSITLVAGCSSDKASQTDGKLNTASSEKTEVSAKTMGEVASDAISALKTAKSFRVHQKVDLEQVQKPDSSVSNDKSLQVVDVVMVGTTDNSNYELDQVMASGSETQTRVIDGRVFVKQNATAWNEFGQPDMATTASDKWMEMTAAGEESRTPSSLVDTWVKTLDPAAKATGSAESTTSNGTPAYRIGDKDMTFVVQANPMYLLEVNGPGMSVQFSEWDSAAPVTVPAADEMYAG